MRTYSVWVYMILMAVITYLIRALPLTLIRKEIKNPFLKSFIYYLPYVTLAAMTFPAILHATANTVSAACGFFAAVILAYFRKSLIIVAAGACITVFLVELLPIL
ncbi:MAG: AzlD domain-containing protein [Lachnospiraceae bacterium]|nr:AzlD domain-containing protein [Lachnospiraceae bacterium]